MRSPDPISVRGSPTERTQIDMKKLYVSAISLALCLFSSSTVFASSATDFTFINDTGRIVTSVKFKAHRSLFWGNNFLLDSIMLPGAIVPMQFWEPPSCNMDIQIRYLDGSSDEYLGGRNLCRTHAIRFTYGRLTSW